MFKRDYTNKTFNELLSEVISRLNSKGVKISSRSDISYILLESMAYLVENLLFYLDLQFNELFLDSAVTEDSILRLAYQLGYQRRGAEPFTIITETEDYTTSNFDIGNYSFVRLESVGTVSISDKFYRWPGRPDNFFYEGEIVYTPISKGDEETWQFREIWLPVSPGYQPAHNFIFMQPETSAGVLYTPYEGFVTSDERRYFLARYYNNGIKVILGDGEFLELPADNTIEFYYLETRGKSFLPTFQTSGIKVINGSDIEDIESVRFYAPRFYWFSDRFITVEDVKEGVRRYNPNYVAHVTSNRGRGWEQPKVIVSVLKRATLGLMELDNSEKNNLQDYIAKRIPFGAGVEVVSDITKAVKVSVIVDVYLNPLATASVVEEAIESVISDIFRGFDFGTKIQVGDIWEKVNEIAGVESASVSFDFEASDSNVVKSLPEGASVPLVYSVAPDYIFSLDEIIVRFH